LNERYEDIVNFSELHNFMDVPIKNFSSGMMARLAFSVATITDPEILIVDEILSVGDPAFQTKSEKKMMSMINGGTTVLYVSHSIDSIRRLCNRVIWLDHGRVVAIGETNRILNAYLRYLGLPT
ncbi:MAG: ABC transporter ATP-binding protein, partial [Oscillospiraceae bacterium]|nr:ABC transporter ATP-binding protein [Oscillospiraceae bacterium]